jgi:Fe-S cluster assembly protein SufD
MKRWLPLVAVVLVVAGFAVSAPPGTMVTANAKPELEIFADDVKCAHGAAIGEIDNNALFYMTSRGVPPAQARALLTRAFLSDALEGLDEATTEALDAEITSLLETAA